MSLARFVNEYRSDLLNQNDIHTQTDEREHRRESDELGRPEDTSPLSTVSNPPTSPVYESTHT